VSLCFAMLVAFVLAMMRQTFLRPESVERSLGLPVLADIPAVR
jgi:capsular polysaccharide biosynthesis protein